MLRQVIRSKFPALIILEAQPLHVLRETCTQLLGGGGVDRDCFVRGITKAPLIGRVRILQVSDGAITSNGVNDVTGIRRPERHKILLIQVAAAGRPQQHGQRTTSGTTTRDNPIGVTRHDTRVGLQVSHGCFKIHNRGRCLAKVHAIRIDVIATACARIDHHKATSQGIIAEVNMLSGTHLRAAAGFNSTGPGRRGATTWRHATARYSTWLFSVDGR